MNLNFSGFIDSDNPIMKGIAGVFIVVMIIALAVAGFGFMGTILMAILVVVAFLFGSLRELIGSFILTILLEYLGNEIGKILSLFVSPEWAASLVGIVEATGFFQLMFAIFFFFYLLAFLTGSINLKPFHIKTNVTNNVKGEDN